MSGVRRRTADQDWPALCSAVARRLIGLGRDYSGLGMGAVTFEQLAGWSREDLVRLLEAVNAEYEKAPPGLRGGFDQMGLKLLAGIPVILPSWLIGADLLEMPVMPIEHYRLSHDGLELVDQLGRT